jgi:ABC-type Na+ efflux pump permease subunit
MLSPILYLLGQATIWDLLISLGNLTITVYLLFEYGLRVYKIGILNYSSKDLWKKVFKSIKEK